MAYPNARQFSLFLPSLLLASTLPTLLAGCGSDDDSVPGEQQATVSFTAQVNSQDFVCGETYSSVATSRSDCQTRWPVADHGISRSNAL